MTANNLLPELSTAVSNTGKGLYDPMMTGGRHLFVPMSFETYSVYSCTPVFVYWGLFNALDKHSDYLRSIPTWSRERPLERKRTAMSSSGPPRFGGRA